MSDDTIFPYTGTTIAVCLADANPTFIYGTGVSSKSLVKTHPTALPNGRSAFTVVPPNISGYLHITDNGGGSYTLAVGPAPVVGPVTP